jgi:hypothetical protein
LGNICDSRRDNASPPDLFEADCPVGLVCLPLYATGRQRQILSEFSDIAVYGPLRPQPAIATLGRGF